MTNPPSEIFLQVHLACQGERRARENASPHIAVCTSLVELWSKMKRDEQQVVAGLFLKKSKGYFNDMLQRTVRAINKQAVKGTLNLDAIEVTHFIFALVRQRVARKAAKKAVKKAARKNQKDEAILHSTPSPRRISSPMKKSPANKRKNRVR